MPWHDVLLEGIGLRTQKPSTVQYVSQLCMKEAPRIAATPMVIPWAKRSSAFLTGRYSQRALFLSADRLGVVSTSVSTQRFFLPPHLLLPHTARVVECLNVEEICVACLQRVAPHRLSQCCRRSSTKSAIEARNTKQLGPDDCQTCLLLSRVMAQKVEEAGKLTSSLARSLQRSTERPALPLLSSPYHTRVSGLGLSDGPVR